MKRKTAIAFTALISAMLLVPGGVYADEPEGTSTLDEFEEDATKPEKERKSDKKHTIRSCDHHDHYCDCDDDDLEWLFFEFLFEVGKYPAAGIAWAGAASLERAGGHVSEEWGVNLPHRTLGEPMVPVFALEAARQRVESDIEATDVRGELGYGPLAIQVRSTTYKESRPLDEIRLTQIHGLYRMSFSPNVEIDLGFGSTELVGDESTSGFSMTTPVRIAPWQFLSAEWRPSWSWLGGKTIRDHSLTVTAGYSVASVTAGYRFVTAGTTHLNGPTLGVGLRF